MYGKRELREHLKQKLDIGDRQLRRLIAAKAAELPSTSDQALSVLAHENGMRLPNYLTAAQIAEVRDLLQGRSPAPSAAPRVGSGRSRTPARTTVVREAKIGDVKVPPSSLSQKHIADAQQMATVYPV